MRIGKEKIDNNVDKIMREKNIMLKELALILNMDERTLCHLKNGDVLPNVLTAVEIAEKLGVTVEELFPLNEHNELLMPKKKKKEK